jgi:Raf kinase inhibitor-like YbhB/YbcL family protein
LVLVGALATSLAAAGCSSSSKSGSHVPPTTKPLTSAVPHTFDASSSAFGHGDPIPKQYTCDGGNVSPPLEWSNAPASTAQVALIVHDPDAPGSTFVHWVIWGLQPNSGTSAGTVPAGATQGNNGSGKLGYTGPCPPSGTHHYHFTFYALSKAPAISAGATAEQLRHAIESTTLAAASFVVTYARG